MKRKKSEPLPQIVSLTSYDFVVEVAFKVLISKPGTHLKSTCSKSRIETLEKGVEYVQRQQ